MSSHPKPESESVPDRVRYLLRTFWDGNQSKMAAATGISQPMISRVVAGRPPGELFLQQLIDSTNCGAEWLLDGKGQPPAKDQLVQRFTLPIISAPSLNIPDEAERTFPVFPGEWSPRRYWLELQPDATVLRKPRSGLLAYDLLLMDADPAARRNLRAIDGLLCVAAVKDMATPVLGWLDFTETEDESVLAIEPGIFQWHQRRNVELVDARAVVDDPTTGDKVVLGPVRFPARKAKDSVGPLRPNDFETVSYRIQRDDLRAVCLAMHRPFTRL